MCPVFESDRAHGTKAGGGHIGDFIPDAAMSSPVKDSFKIVDPRRGEDYLIPTSFGKTVSLRQRELLMISFCPRDIAKKSTVPPSLLLTDLNELMKTSIERLGKIGFVAISPLTNHIKQAIGDKINQIDEMLGSAIGYFTVDSCTIETQFDLRRRLASYAEWSIGSCENPFAKPAEPKWYQQAIYWDTNFLFTQVENVGCLSVFHGETGELIFFTSIYPGIDKLLDPVRLAVENPAGIT